ncbi:MAG TPA: ThiF family adenylyltransferase [Rhodocyclaceae bacterium]|nr:ThiF family adenylyltransferase [Rhodocyclaceae bacterium]
MAEPLVESYEYDQAFARNIGWVTVQEQTRLRNMRIAIAGMGGVGGSHLITLARLGIGRFTIADGDSFELVNFNRQIGATLDTLGRSKTEVLAEMLRKINPDVDVRVFNGRVHQDNLAEFLDGADAYVDSLDFFAFEARRQTFAMCHRLKIPAVTAAPLGMGSAVLSFLPGRMSFEEYFRLEGHSEQEQAIRFLIGLSPAMLQRAYLADASRVNLAEHRGPSTIMACQMCAGFAATETLKILLGRGKVLAAPWGYQFDAYRNRFVRTWRPFGNNNPIQRVALWIARRQLAAMAEAGKHAA